MVKIKIPFKTKKNIKGATYQGVGYFFIKNNFIIKQELKLESAVIRTRRGTNENSGGYKNNFKKWPRRKEILGQDEFKNRNSNDKVATTVELSKSDLRCVESIINNAKTGTILSTLHGLLKYTNVSGSICNVKNSPIVINGGKYDGHRFYNLFNEEFAKSSQVRHIPKKQNIKEITIEEWVDYKPKNKLQFSLYNYEKQQEYLMKRGFITEGITKPTYDKLLGRISKDTSQKNMQIFLNALRTKFKTNVMNHDKYEFDFIYNDTRKENTEAAHIYEVHMIKQLCSSPEEIRKKVTDHENCLLLTPSVHKAWDRHQIKINHDGKIENIEMEDKRFKRMFSKANNRITFALTEKQMNYLKIRNSNLYGN